MDRRTFLAGTGAVLLAAPLAAEAQPAGKVWRIGYLGISRSSTDTWPIWTAFLAGRRERGWTEGRNVVIERRYTEEGLAYESEDIHREVSDLSR